MKVTLTLVTILLAIFSIADIHGIRCYLCSTILDPTTKASPDVSGEEKEYIESKGASVSCKLWAKKSMGQILNSAHDCPASRSACFKEKGGNDRGCMEDKNGTVPMGCQKEKSTEAMPKFCICNNTDLCNKATSSRSLSPFFWGLVVVCSIFQILSRCMS